MRDGYIKHPVNRRREIIPPKLTPCKYKPIPGGKAKVLRSGWTVPVILPIEDIIPADRVKVTEQRSIKVREIIEVKPKEKKTMKKLILGICAAALALQGCATSDVRFNGVKVHNAAEKPEKASEWSGGQTLALIGVAAALGYFVTREKPESSPGPVICSEDMPTGCFIPPQAQE